MATKISRDEVLKIARMSHMHIHEHEIDQMQHQLEQILSYAERVQHVTQEMEESIIKNSNVSRQDQVFATDPEPLLNLAPERQDHYYVVPVILENN